MNKFIKISFSAIMFTVAVLTIASSCKKQFDAPPADVAAAKLTPNYTIAQLKAKHTVSGNIERIDSSSDIIIRAIVIADDKSGNYYKTLVIQDSTGGLALLVNGSSLYNTFPIGREVFIKCNGLYLGDYNNQIQMGGGIQTGSTSSLADIPSAILEKNVFKGTLNNVVVPKDVLPAQLTTTMQDKYQNTLIRLTNVEFDWHDTTKTFASAGITSPSAASFNLKYCASLSSPNSDPGIALRTSNYANFASTPLPTGNGTIVAIYSVYTRYKQLAIRDASDVQFSGSRCGSGGSGGGGGTGTLTTLSHIRSLYTGSDILLSTAYKVTGVVISDAANKNINKSTVIIQDGATGISIYFGSTVAYNIGDSVVIDITGDSLLKFRGSLQIKAVPSQLSPAVATNRTVTPNIVTINQLNTAMALPLSTGTHIENTLIKILNATASGSPATYGGNKTLTDVTGNLVLRTSTTASGPATFAASPLPTGAKTWTGYCNFFNTTPQFQIRNPALDVQ